MWLLCRFGEYDLHDLVELDQMTAGVMIAADAETCQILTNRNAVSLPYNVCFRVSYVSAMFSMFIIGPSIVLLCHDATLLLSSKCNSTLCTTHIRSLRKQTLFSTRPSDVCKQPTVSSWDLSGEP